MTAPDPGGSDGAAPAPAPTIVVDPMREAARSDRLRAVRVGALTLTSLAVLIGLIVFTGPLAVVRGHSLQLDFAYAGPIKPGAAVRISGVEVGVVQRVELLAGLDPAAGKDKMVRLHARIEERARPVLTDRARFRVTTLGVLGEHYLDVEPVLGGAPLADGARVDGESLARADLLLARAAGLFESAESLLPSSPDAVALMRSLTSLAARLDVLLGSRASEEAVDDVRALVADLRVALRGAAVGIGDGAALRRSIETLPGLLDKTGKVEDVLLGAEIIPLVHELRGTLSRLDRTLELVSAAPLLEPGRQEALRQDVTAAMRSIDAVATRADRVLAALEQGRGGAGQLFWDEKAAQDLRVILHGLRDNPVGFLLGRDKK